MSRLSLTFGCWNYDRMRALADGRVRRGLMLELDLEHFTYTAPKRKPVELPKDMELRLLTAAQELTGEKAGRIRFYPDGSSTGGRVKLVRGQRAWDIEIAWLTGEVAMRQGEATP